MDELRDFDIVDGDRGLAPPRDDQVLLLGPGVQFQTPSGYAVDETTGEVSARKVRAHQSGRPEVRPAEVGLAEVCLD